jgi:hypothetical protein
MDHSDPKFDFFRVSQISLNNKDQSNSSIRDSINDKSELDTLQ